MPKQFTLSEQLTFCTARIVCQLKGGGVTTGTGFFFNLLKNGESHVPVIVTNKHVVAEAVEGAFTLTRKAADGSPDIGQHVTLTMGDFEKRWIGHPADDVDLAIMPVAPLLAEASAAGHSFHYSAADASIIIGGEELEDLGALEDIVMIGYPNGIWDAVNNMPIIRRGVTATHPNLNYAGRKEFMIDAACFPGSSGSPVFLYNANGWVTRSGNIMMGGTRVRLLGALYAGPQHTATGELEIVDVPSAAKPVAISRIPNNLGLVIKAERLLEFEPIVKKLMK